MQFILSLLFGTVLAIVMIYIFILVFKELEERGWKYEPQEYENKD